MRRRGRPPNAGHFSLSDTAKLTHSLFMSARRHDFVDTSSHQNVFTADRLSPHPRTLCKQSDCDFGIIGDDSRHQQSNDGCLSLFVTAELFSHYMPTRSDKLATDLQRQAHMERISCMTADRWGPVDTTHTTTHGTDIEQSPSLRDTAKHYKSLSIQTSQISKHRSTEYVFTQLTKSNNRHRTDCIILDKHRVLHDTQFIKLLNSLYTEAIIPYTAHQLIILYILIDYALRRLKIILQLYTQRMLCSIKFIEITVVYYNTVCAYLTISSMLSDLSKQRKLQVTEPRDPENEHLSSQLILLSIIQVLVQEKLNTRMRLATVTCVSSCNTLTHRHGYQGNERESNYQPPGSHCIINCYKNQFSHLQVVQNTPRLKGPLSNFHFSKTLEIQNPLMLPAGAAAPLSSPWADACSAKPSSRTHISIHSNIYTCMRKLSKEQSATPNDTQTFATDYPNDADNDSVNHSKNDCSSSSATTTATNRNSSIVGRRSIRGSSLGGKSGREGDDEDGNKRGDSTTSKIKTVCEADDVVNNDEKDTGNTSPNLDAYIQIYQDHCDNFNNGNSTQIDLDLAEEINHQPITEMSILGGISKIWGIAKNVSIFGASQKVSISQVPNTPDFTLDLSLSDVTIANFTPDHGCTKDAPTRMVTFSANVELEETDDHESSEENFHTPTKPYFSPKSRSPHGDTRTIMTLSTSVSRRQKTRFRSRSESSSRSSRPYSRPPTVMLRKRLLEKLGTQGANDTPLSRRRSASESDANANAEMTSFETHKFNDSFACTQIRTEGVHQGGSGSVHLCHNFLSTQSQVSKMDVVLAIQKMFWKATNPLDYTASLYWSHDQLYLSGGSESPTSSLSTPVPVEPCPILEELLLLFNEHITNNSSCATHYKGLKIVSMPDRSRRLPISCKPNHENDYRPTAILHLGKDRSLDMIPKKYSTFMKDVFDVQLGNFSVLTLLPDTQREMTIYLPGERPLEEFDGDHHIIITPTMESIDGSINPASQSPCVSLQTEIINSICNENATSPDSSKKEEYPAFSNTAIVEKKDSPDSVKSTEISIDIYEQAMTDIAVSDTLGEGDPRTNGSTATAITETDTPQICKALEQYSPAIVSHVASENGKQLKHENNIVKCVTEAKTNKSICDTMKDDNIKIQQNQSLQGHDHFISMSRCVDIINSHNSDIIQDWLKKCNIMPIGSVQSYRAYLLEYLQKSNEGVTYPPQIFLDSFLKKLLGPALDEELSMKNVAFSPSSSVVIKRRLLLDKLHQSRNTILINGAIETSSLSAPPPMLHCSDAESSSSTSVTENDSDSSFCLPKANKQKTNISPINKNKNSESKNKSKNLKPTGKTKKTPMNKKSNDNSVKGSSHVDVYVKAIKTLEDTILRLQDRINNQDTAIESLNKKINESNVTDHTDTKINDRTQKIIKKLEINVNQLFETNNHQQTSIDVLIDRIEKQNKTDKWLRDKISQFNGESCQKSKELENSLQTTKKDLQDVASHNSNVTTEIKEMRHDIRLLQNLSRIQVQEMERLSMHPDASEFKYQQFKAMQPVMSELLTYNENCRNNIITSISSDHSYSRRNEQAPKNVFWDKMLVQEKEIPVSTTVTISSKDTHTYSCPESETFEKLYQKNLDEVVITEEIDREASNNDKSSTCNIDTPSTENVTSKQQPETFSVSDNEKLNCINNTSPYSDSGNQTVPHMHPCPKNNPVEGQPDTWTRFETRSPSHLENSEPTEEDDSAHQSNIYQIQTTPDNRNRHTNSQRYVPPSSSNESIYRTRKCLLIHDPYLRTFQREKFTKWLDVECLEADSFSSLLRKGSLVSTINKVKPEAVLIHLGQGDVWKKIDPDTIIGYAKQTIWKLINSTDVKICISLLIPLLGSPQQHEVIQKINEELSSFITELRKVKAYSDRIYSSNNSSLSGYIKYSTGPHGKKLDLTERGLAKYWLMMRDAIRRTLGVNSARQNRQRTTIAPRNEPNDD